MPISQVPPNTNFSPTITPWTYTKTDGLPGERVYTELARSFVPLVGTTPLTEIFPEEVIPERAVIIQRSFEAAAGIFPLVDWGKPDVVLGTGSSGVMGAKYIQPLVIRRTAAISYGELGVRVRPGTSNEPYSPQEQINQVIEGMVREHNLTWDVFRALMLLGGINYTDPRTGSSAQVDAGIPAHNFWGWNVSSGYKGRPENLLFLNLIDNNSVDATSAGTPWTDPNADVLGTVMKFASWFKTTNKSRITSMYMSPSLAHVLSFNNQVKMSRGGTIFGLGSAPIIRETPDPGVQGMFTMGQEGLASIAGIPIRIVETSYRDPVTGIFKYVWPKNKIVFVSEVGPNGQPEMPGRTQFCVSEEMGNTPGLWVRTQDNSQPPAPPGMYIQMGNAGMPYLKSPYSVAHMTVAKVNDINKRLGVVGDMGFGIL